MLNWLINRIARRRKLQERQLLSARARRGHAQRIHNQFLRDPLIRTKNEAAMATHRAASPTLTEVI